MVIQNIKNKNSPSQIIVCVLLSFVAIIGTLGMYKFEQTNEFTEKVICNIMAAGGLGLLVNLLTTMFFGESKRRELAETIFERLYATVDQILIKSETERLTQSEFVILSQLSGILGQLSKYCAVNMDLLNNKYQRLIQNPPQYTAITVPPPTFYGSEQSYGQVLNNLQHQPTLANSGSTAPLVVLDTRILPPTSP